jgi:hypothetical protein
LSAISDELAIRTATRLKRYEPDPPLASGHIVMLEPEDNEFCLD